MGVGGGKDDYGSGIAVDSAGNLLLTGQTDSLDWVSGEFDTSFNGYWDGFVTKLSPAGSHLWSTYFGGGGPDSGGGIVVDWAGNALVTRETSSSGWVSLGFDTSLDVGPDAFVLKINSDFPRIVGVQRLTNGHVQLNIDVTAVSATNLVVESADTLTGTIPWGEEVSAVITMNTSGWFEALVPPQGNARFYRIRSR